MINFTFFIYVVVSDFLEHDIHVTVESAPGKKSIKRVLCRLCGKGFFKRKIKLINKYQEGRYVISLSRTL